MTWLEIVAIILKALEPLISEWLSDLLKQRAAEHGTAAANPVFFSAALNEIFSLDEVTGFKNRLEMRVARRFAQRHASALYAHMTRYHAALVLPVSEDERAELADLKGE